MPTTSILGELVDVEGAAAMLHCSVANIRKLHTTGRLPRVRCGRRVLCRISDLEKLLVVVG